MVAIPYPIINETPNYTWTVDFESDWGGRSNGAIGIDEGIPRILKLFHSKGIRGLFFISTEMVKNRHHVIRDILNEGHQIGSHGHFHTLYKESFRAIQDKKISEEILYKYSRRQLPYRAPKFSFLTECVYSNPKNHVGLLKYMWFGGRIPEEPIFYLHPFDIVKGKNAPNLFCKLWYAHPKKAYDTLCDLTDLYPGSHWL